MSVDPTEGIVYILTNPAMPGLVKIGRTSRITIEPRLIELYSTGVPLPFECAYAARVIDEQQVESAFHLAFGPYRVNQRREFFEIEPEQAIALLRLMQVEDVTPEVQRDANHVDEEAKAGADRLKSRRPNLNFAEMGIPVGSFLKFIRDERQVEVIDERRVRYEGKECYLTAITREFLEIEHSVAPTPHWSYNGKGLQEIYVETYGER